MRGGRDTGSLSDVHRWWIWFICAGAAQGWSCGPRPIIVSMYSASGVCRFDDSNDGRNEIDKFGQSNYHVDPSAALLEVLDPGQNVTFKVRFPRPEPRAFFP
jgi:hypothetical protein